MNAKVKKHTISSRTPRSAKMKKRSNAPHKPRFKIGLNARFLLEPYTGIGQYTWNLIIAMAKQDRTIGWILAVPQPPIFKDPNLKLPPNTTLLVIPEMRLPSASLRKFIWEQWQAPRALYKARPHLIHYPYPANPRFPRLTRWFTGGSSNLNSEANSSPPHPHRTSRTFRAPRALHPKVLVTVHDTIPWTHVDYRRKCRSRLYHHNAQKALRNADHLICVSQTTALALTDRLDYPFHHIFIIHEAAAPLFLRKKQKWKYDKPYLLYVGGYDPRKNVNRLVEAYQEYIAPKFNIDLLLVGAKNAMAEAEKGSTRLLKALPLRKIKDLQQGHRGKVLPLPALLPEQLAKTYRGALGFVNVSLAEGFNLPLLEAAASEIPILTSDIPIHREIIGENGRFCDPKSTRSIGELLLHFVRDEHLQAQLKDATKLLNKQYSWEKTAKETLALYRKFSDS